MSTRSERPSEATGPPQPDAGAQGFKGGLRGKEPRRLLLRFVGVIVTAPVIGWMMGRAWVPGNELYDAIETGLSNLLGLPGYRSLQLVGVFGVGLYLALLFLFLFDIKKRIQGMLLLIGTVIALGVVTAMGVFIPHLQPTPLNGVGFVLGLVSGFFLESNRLVNIDRHASSFRRPTLGDGTIPEFRFAARALFGILALLVIVSLVQVIMAGTVHVPDAPVAGLFLLMLFQFIQYDSEANYMTLGPGRSGKSMMMLGICLELMQNSDIHPRPNDYLQSGLERASNLQPGNEHWPIPSTPHDELRLASFEVISGYYFPRRLELKALDYAGQHLGRVADIFRSGSPPDEPTSIPEEVAHWVDEGDTLLVILDIERLMFPGEFQEQDTTEGQDISWGLEHYGTILDAADPDDVIIIATKIDILIDLNELPSLAGYQQFETFRDDVTDYLSARPDVQQLLDMSNESTIHPVYFVTIKRDGEYKPKLDEHGNLMPVGYDHLVDEIRRRQ